MSSKNRFAPLFDNIPDRKTRRMKAILIAVTIAAGFATIAVTSANAGAGGGFGRSYAYDYCYYYKTRALGAKSPERKNLMWAKYRTCLKEYGG